MTKYIDIFDHKLEQAQQQFEGLLQQVSQESDASKLLNIACQELFTALEEVHILLEEVTAQHEQLQTAQLVLKTERQQYFELFDLAPDGYLVTTVEGVLRQVNRVAANSLNRRQDLLVGKPIAALVLQSELRDFYTVLTQLQQGKSFQNVIFRLQPYQRAPIYASFTIAPWRDHQGQLAGLHWLFRDLTQQRRAAIALEESEAQYRAIVEDQTELICRSLSDGRITFVNQAFCQYFERSSESLMGESFFDLILAADQERVMRQLATLDYENPMVTCDHRVTLGNGQIRWQQWSHRALFDRNGFFFQFQSAGCDVTAQRQAEEALHQREAQLRLVTDALPVLIAHVDTKQRLIYANRTHEQWLGQPEDFIGRYLWEILGPTYYQQIRIPVDQALMGDYVTFEEKVIFPNSAPFWIQATFVPDKSVQGEVKGFFALINDISDRKTLELQQDQFISIVSHELRTPLTSIHGALRLLVSDLLAPDSEEGRRLLRVADSSTKRLVMLLQDLLDIQQIKLGKLPVDPKVCQVDELIGKAIEILQVMAKTEQITLTTIPCALSVWADPERIIQVLTNLLSNAIKFSPSGSQVWVTAEPVKNQPYPTVSNPIKVCVRDQGSGIPITHLDHVFDAFNLVDAEVSRSKGGTGLGLAICRSIVEQHGGRIEIDRTSGDGTTVWFTLPLAA
ncbi:MAG: PAS domain-containing protein [Cyanobacteria bacterium P01_A01_bin.114]